MNLIITFIVLNIVNVIIHTVKSIVTIKCGKWMAALVNAIAYGFYTVVVIYMVSDINLWAKIGIVAICNFIGVFAVKFFEEKSRKEKLWKVEFTVNATHGLSVHNILKEIPHSYIPLGSKYTLFNCYCQTQEESKAVKQIVEKFGAKYCVFESKTL